MSSRANRTSVSHRLVWAGVLAIVAATGGCGDFFADKSTEVEAESVLNKLTQITTVSEPNIAKPAVYQTPPEIVRQIVSGVEEYKLFYFCKYHTSDKLRQIINDQFATQLFDEKGKSTNVKDYTVSSNPATNQLIVRCPAQEDVEAVLEVLQAMDIPPIQVKIDCMISEVYADMTMDRETTLEIKELFGEDIFLGGKRAPSTYTSAGGIGWKEGELWPAFPGAALREVAHSRFGLKVGYTTPDVTALIDILQSRGYLKILMNPSLEVVNGQTAKISSSEHVPLQQVTSYLPTTGTYILETKTEYIDVIDSLEITPMVFADGYIGLQTVANIASKNTPEGVKQVPIITKREISNKENRIRQGESLIIGGIRKSERFAVVRGVPFLKDIPVLGLLFSSKDFEERAKETIFILTPTISTGGMPNEEIVDRVRKEHEPPVPAETLRDAVTDPFGFGARDRQQQREMLEAEQARLQSEKEKALARGAIHAAEQKAALVEEEAAKATAQAKKVMAKAEKMQADAEAKAKAADAAKAASSKAAADAQAAQAAAEQIKAAAAKATTEAAVVKAEAEKIALDANKTKAEADQAKAVAEKAAAEAAAVKAKAEQAATDAKKSKAEADQAKADADARAKAADAAKAAAEKAAADAKKSKAEADQAKAKAQAAAEIAAEKKAQQQPKENQKVKPESVPVDRPKDPNLPAEGPKT